MITISVLYYLLLCPVAVSMKDFDCVAPLTPFLPELVYHSIVNLSGSSVIHNKSPWGNKILKLKQIYKKSIYLVKQKTER